MMQSKIDASPNQIETEELKRLSRNGFYTSLLIFILAIAFGIYRTVAQLGSPGVLPTRMPWVFMLALIGLVGMYLSWRQQVKIVAYLLLSCLALFSITLVIPFQGVLTALSGAFTAFQIAIVLLIFPTKRSSQWIIALLVFNIALLLFDLFGSESRIELSDPLSSIFNTVTYIALGMLFFIGTRYFQFYSIRSKLFMVTMAVAILSVLTIAFSVTRAAQNSLLETTGHDLKQIADQESIAFGELVLQELKIIQTLVGDRVLQTETLAQSNRYTGSTEEIEDVLLTLDPVWANSDRNAPFITGVLDNELSSILRNFQSNENFRQHIEVFVADKHGGLVASTDKTSDYYQADEDWWVEAYNNGQGGVFIDQPQFDDSSGEYSINMSVPVIAPAEITPSGSPEVVGVLRTTVELSYFSELIGLALGESSTNDRVDVFLGNETKIVILPDGNVARQEITSEEKALIEALRVSSEDSLPVLIGDQANETRVIAQSENSNESGLFVEGVASYSDVATHEGNPYVDALDGWYILIARPQADILSGLSEQSQITIILSIVTVTLSGIAAVVLGRTLTQPIFELTEAAKRIEAGDRLVRATVNSNDELGQMASSINHMMDELNAAVGQRELRVSERTQALMVATEVGRELSSILDLDVLLRTVVNKVRSAFDYYHAQIYLWNDDRSKLILRNGTGTAGQQMMQNNHFIVAGKGVVGHAAENEAPFFIRDIRDTGRPAFWLPNALLPDTVSEAAVPIVVGSDVIGVLDVQDSIPGKMTDEDINILRIVSGQIGVAIQNANLYDSAKRKAENEAMILEINRKIQASSTIEDAMKVAAGELGKHFRTKTKVSLIKSEPQNGTHSNNGTV